MTTTGIPPQYKERVPTANDTTTTISELVENGQRQQVLKRKIVYDMRPLIIICALIGFCFFTAFAAFTIDQVSRNATARACFAAGSEWTIDNDGNAECLKPHRNE